MAKNNFPIRVAKFIDAIPERVYAEALILAAAIGVPAAQVIDGLIEYEYDKASDVVDADGTICNPATDVCHNVIPMCMLEQDATDRRKYDSDIVPDTIPMQPKHDTQLEPINEPMYFNIA